MKHKQMKPVTILVYMT